MMRRRLGRHLVSEFNRRIFGDDVYEAMRGVKQLFDPDDRLNPGVIVDAAPMTADLRDPALPSPGPLRTRMSFAEHGGMRGAADRCQRIGACRKTGIGVMCPSYVGGVVSAFASTTGILGALIPLAVPFLETGAVGAVGLIIALSISSSVVDSSPFSTSGALTVANTPAEKRDLVFRRLMQWGMSMVLVAPPIAWLVFVVPGWL
jgi:FAD linked oxidases, C-terminal domain